jgi:DNA-binding Lrp family transcriptional regulator
VDALDHAILRELGRDQVLLWGGMDPRVSATQLADRLGVDRGTIRARMRAWVACGFLRRFVALPNPHLLGVGLAAGGVRVSDVKDKPRVLDDLALVDGMLSAMEHVGEWIGLAFVDDGKAAIARRMKLLERVPGVAEVQPPLLWGAPLATIDPTPLQWRVLAALRASDARDAKLGELAKRVGVSPNTFHAHYDALVRGGAVWSVPELDFAKWDGAPLARLVVVLAPEASRASCLKALRDIAPDLMPHPTPQPMAGDAAFVSVMVHLPSLGAIEDAALRARALPDVREVEVLYPKSFRVYDAWFEERFPRAASTKPSSSTPK